jgi:tetratricopeptide (TPR) repeat protein
MCVSPQSAEFERSMQKMIEIGLLIARGETSPRLYLQYSEALWNVRDLQATVGALDAAIDGQPPLSRLELARAYASRSICYLQMGDSQQAIDDASTSLDLVPRAHPYGLRAVTYQHLERFAEAQADIEAASRIDPDDWEVRAWRGMIYGATGRHAEALSEFSWVLQTGECHRYASEVYLGRARAYLATGRAEAAAADCDQAIQEDYHEQSHWPFIVRARGRSAHEAYLVRAEARLTLGKLAMALGDCCFAASITPGDPTIYELRARVYEAVGNLQETVRDLIRASHLRSSAESALTEPALAAVS